MDNIKTLVQSDFDGTITEQDISFMILEEFADGDWKNLLEDYRQGKISVGKFNKDTFSMVKESREILAAYSRANGVIRDGFKQLVEYCHSRGFRFVITSNGLDFYIEVLLKEIGLSEIEFHAARTNFDNGILQASYIGPDGKELLKGFKQAYTRSFINEGYRVIYLGNGPSDVESAKLAYRTFATDSMIRKCKEQSVCCTPFNELKDIIEELKKID